MVGLSLGWLHICLNVIDCHLSYSKRHLSHNRSQKSLFHVVFLKKMAMSKKKINVKIFINDTM